MKCRTCNKREGMACALCLLERFDWHEDWLRDFTAKPPRNATQRERNIYQAATRLLANLEGGESV